MSIQSIAAGTPVIDSALAPRPSAAPAAAAFSAPGAARPVSGTPAIGEAAAAAASGQSSGSAPDALLHAVNELRAAIAPVEQNLLFSIDDDTGHTVVKVVDAATDEVIRQIPSEEVLAVTKALDKLQGVLIQQKA